MMKKILSTILISMSILFLLVGCGSSKAKDVTIDSIKQSFADAGMTVGENKEVMFQMIGANNGVKFDINEETVELYYYDSKNLSDDGKEYVKQAKEGSVSILGMSSKPALYKDGFMLINYENHKDKDKIVETFNSNFK
ncbi:MAG: hypothetical protein ACLSV2_08435 [Clostridium sp.]